MNINALKVYLARNSTTGEIDYKASAEKLYADLSAYETLHDDVAKAIGNVFTRFKGTKINKPGVVSFAMPELNVTPDSFEDMKVAIVAYLDTNTGTKESGAMFGSVKGPGGGTFLWADVVVKPAKEGK